MWHSSTNDADWYWRTESFFEDGILKLQSIRVRPRV